MEDGSLTYQDSALPKSDDSSQAANENTDDVHAPRTFIERWKDAEYRKKYLKTLCLGGTYWSLGFCIGQRGPAFLDLQIITNTDVEAASFFFTSASIGYLIGSFVAGFVYDKLNMSLLLLLYMLGMAATTVAIPWCSIYALMIAINLAFGVFSSGVDTVANTALVRVWGKEGEMAMQFFHFSFAFGGVIAPLITEPFLTPLPHKNNTLELVQNHETNASSLLQNSSLDSTPSTFNSHFSSIESSTALSSLPGVSNTTSLPLTTDVQYAYYISGILAILISLPIAMEFLQERYQKRRQDEKDEQKDVKQPLPLTWLLFVTGVLCVFYFVYCCVDDTFASFLATFVVKQLHWSKARAAQISSIFWASFAVGRFFSIFLIHFLGTAWILVLSCLSLILSMIGFLLFAQHAITVGVWVCAFLSGMSMGPVFGAGFTWMEEEVMRVTGRVVAVIMIASSAGNMVNPVLTGFLMQDYSPMWFCYLLLAECVVCLLVLFFLLALSRCYISKHFVIHPANDQEVQVTSLSDDKSENGAAML